MSYKELLHKMKSLKLHGMATSYQTVVETNRSVDFTNDELLNYLIEAEWNDKEQRRMARHIKNAAFRYDAHIEQIDYDPERKLDKNLVMRLADCSYLARNENVIITGATGCGKSYLASALGLQACVRSHSTIYYNSSKLFDTLQIAKADNSHVRLLQKIQKQKLLIIDDFGLHKFTPESRLLFMEIIEDRHERSSTIISSQFPVTAWHALIGSATIADAILDRLVYSSHRIELSGPSLRQKYKNID